MAEHSRDERWAAIPEYEGWYEASSHGRVRSVPRTVTIDSAYGVHVRTYRSRYLKPDYSKMGYPRVCLRMNGAGSWVYVHRMVLLAFRGEAPEGMQGCHNDSNPANCHLENLRWDTQTNNLLDAVLGGTHWQVKKRVCPLTHPLEYPNLVKSQLTIPGRRGGRSCLACARAHGQKYYAESKGIEFDFEASAHDHYAKILAGVVSRIFLPLEDVRAIEVALEAGEPTKDLAARYGASVDVIRRIKNGTHRMQRIHGEAS